MSRIKKICVTLAPLIVAVCLAQNASADDLWPYIQVRDGGAFADMALDPTTGLPRVASWTVDDLDWVLLYTEYNGTSWSVPVEVSRVAGLLHDTSLALTSSGDPRIAYCYTGATLQTGYYTAVRYVIPGSPYWTQETVYQLNGIQERTLDGFHHVSLAFAKNGQPAVAFSGDWLKEAEPEYEPQGGVYYSLRDATSGWPATPDEIYFSDEWETHSQWGVSLAMDKNASTVEEEPRIAYDAGAQVYYAKWDSGSNDWDRDPVATGVGRLQLRLDPFSTSTVKPRLVHVGPSHTLKYRESANDGVSWTATLELGNENDGDDPPRYGGPTLAIDPNTGRPKIAYVYTTASETEVHAKCYGGASGWQDAGSGAVSDRSDQRSRMHLDPVSGMPSVLAIRDGVGLIVAYQLSGGMIQNWYRITDNSGANLLLFGSGGDVVITTGDLTETATGGQLDATAAKEFIVQDSALDEVARIDDSGDMWIKGEVTDEVSSPSPSDPALIIKDSSGDIQSFIDENGDMELRGFVYEKGVQKDY